MRWSEEALKSPSACLRLFLENQMEELRRAAEFLEGEGLGEFLVFYDRLVRRPLSGAALDAEVRGGIRSTHGHVLEKAIWPAAPAVRSASSMPDAASARNASFSPSPAPRSPAAICAAKGFGRPKGASFFLGEADRPSPLPPFPPGKHLRRARARPFRSRLGPQLHHPHPPGGRVPAPLP